MVLTYVPVRMAWVKLSGCLGVGAYTLLTISYNIPSKYEIC